MSTVWNVLFGVERHAMSVQNVLFEVGDHLLNYKAFRDVELRQKLQNHAQEIVDNYIKMDDSYVHHPCPFARQSASRQGGDHGDE
jgi:hypothetical protein